jgi:hypothetical protein
MSKICRAGIDDAIVGLIHMTLFASKSYVNPGNMCAFTDHPAGIF